MKETIELNLEKELFEELMQRYVTQLKLHRAKKPEASGTKPYIALRQVGVREHRPFNPCTGRFHNIELGIDEVV